MDIGLLTYITIITAGTVTGLSRFKVYNTTFKLVTILLTLTVVSELLSAITLRMGLGKSPPYHIFNPVEAIIISGIFITTVMKSPSYRHLVWPAVTWGILGISNTAILQPLTLLNSNFLILESFVVIALSLFALYKMLTNDEIIKPLRHPEFYLWVCFLIYSSSTFFFWSCVPLFYRQKSPFYTFAASVEMTANYIMYMGIGVLLAYYPKFRKIEQ